MEYGVRLITERDIMGCKGVLRINLVGRFWQSPNINEILAAIYDIVHPHNEVEIIVVPSNASDNTDATGVYLQRLVEEPPPTHQEKD